MKSLRSSIFLAPILCLLASVDHGRAAAGRLASLPVGTITGLTEPMIRQVVQRRDDNFGNILFVGNYSGNVDGFQARSLLRPGMSGTPLDWTPLGGMVASGGGFVG